MHIVIGHHQVHRLAGADRREYNSRNHLRQSHHRLRSPNYEFRINCYNFMIYQGISGEVAEWNRTEAKRPWITPHHITPFAHF